MPTEMTADIQKLLREPFPPELIGKLPRVFCKQCREGARFGKVCDNHQKVKCRDCGNNMTNAHLHLDYVGHAETTDRFLSVDPEWNWEPVAFGPDGLPAIDKAGGLWIRLTIAGVTRLGYGHANGKEGPDAIKEAIGDALRNAGMRFGVALDLWGAKFKDGGSGGSEHPDAPADAWESATPAKREPAPSQAQTTVYDDLAKRVQDADNDETLKAVWNDVKAAFSADKLTTKQGNDLRAAVDQVKATFVPAGAR